ncbi:MAG: hypothetical protein Tsb002_15300 [Wenzhouxiangellaceae bacterium]
MERVSRTRRSAGSIGFEPCDTDIYISDFRIQPKIHCVETDSRKCVAECATAIDADKAWRINKFSDRNRKNTGTGKAQEQKSH